MQKAIDIAQKRYMDKRLAMILRNLKVPEGKNLDYVWLAHNLWKANKTHPMYDITMQTIHLIIHVKEKYENQD